MSLQSPRRAADPAPRTAPRPVHIGPPSRLPIPDLRELAAYRELLLLLIRRDISVKYKQTLLGASWAVLQPLLTMIVFSVFFGGMAKIPSDGVPYPVFSLAALVPWAFFANGLVIASNSLVQNVSLVTKVYFPRILLPLAGLLAGLVDLAIAFAILVVVGAAFGIMPTWGYLWIPLLVLLMVVAATGVTTGLAALNVRYRDVRYVVPFLTQLWLFLTPIAYSASLVSSRWRPLEGLNPMAGVVEGFRSAMLHTNSGSGGVIAVSVASSLVLLIGGLAYFQHTERSFADVV